MEQNNLNTYEVLIMVPVQHFVSAASTSKALHAAQALILEYSVTNPSTIMMGAVLEPKLLGLAPVNVEEQTD